MFNPPQSVYNAARRGVQLVERFDRQEFSKGEAGSAGVPSGVASARNLSLLELIEARDYFKANKGGYQPDKREDDQGPTYATIDWLLHGGNAGQDWIERVIKSIGEELVETVHRHNEKNTGSEQRASIASVVKVYSRAQKDGYPDPMVRVNSFMRLLRKGKPGNVNYIEDNDLLPITHKRSTRKPSPGEVEVLKADETLGIVMGYGIVCQQDSEDYYDVQGDHIPENSMLKAAAQFMEGDRVAKNMHTGDQIGKVVFAFPMTYEIAESLGIEISKSGLLIGMKPDDEELIGKYLSGEYTGFSIGGRRITDIEVD